MPKPREASEEEKIFAKKIANEELVDITNCKIWISKKENLICYKKGTMQQVLFIPKSVLRGRSGLAGVQCQISKKTKAQRREEKRRQREQARAAAEQKASSARTKLSHELINATAEINKEKEANKNNPCFGNVETVEYVSIDNNFMVSAFVYTSIEIIRKKEVIANLARAERGVSLDNWKEELTKEYLKNRIKSVIKRPVQDVSLTKAGGEHVWDVMVKYLKKIPGLKMEEDFWLLLGKNEQAIFSLIHKLHSRKYSNPKYIPGCFDNQKFKNECIFFNYRGYGFVYDILHDTISMDEKQLEFLVNTAAKIEAQKGNIKTCRKAIAAIRQKCEEETSPCDIQFVADGDLLSIDSSKCKGYLKISPVEKTTTSAVKKWFFNGRKEREKEITKRLQEKEDRVRAKVSYGNLLAVSALKLIMKNERYITENAVVKNLRGLSQTLSARVLDIEESDKFGLLSSEDVEAAVGMLIRDNLVYRKEIKGTYGWFDILKVHDGAAKELLQVTYKEEKKKFSEYNDLDWVNYLEKVKAAGKESRLTNAKKEEQLSLLEHKNVFVLYPELTGWFLKTKPESWKTYIETMYSLAAGVEKKYWKMVKEMIK